MLKFAATMVLLLFGFSPLVHGQPAQPVKEAGATRFLPLASGNQWHYLAESQGMQTTIVAQIVRIETINGKPLARLQVAVGGKAIGDSEHLEATAQGIYRHRINDVEISPPLCLLKYPFKPGESWSIDCKIGGQDATILCKVGPEVLVEVPAGKFKAIPVKVTTEENGNRVIGDFWFSAGVGIVKQNLEVGTVRTSLALEKFTLAPIPAPGETPRKERPPRERPGVKGPPDETPMGQRPPRER